MNEKILNLIIRSVKEVNEQLIEDKDLEQSAETILFGKEGKLDSLALVNLLVAIEQNIEDEYDITITIADEKAMSQERSPFRTIGTLVDYIDMLINDK